MQQFTESPAKVRDVFHLLLQGSDIRAYWEIKLSLALRHVCWKDQSQTGQAGVIELCRYSSWTTQAERLLLLWDTLLHPWVGGPADRNPGDGPVCGLCLAGRAGQSSAATAGTSSVPWTAPHHQWGSSSPLTSHAERLQPTGFPKQWTGQKFFPPEELRASYLI